MIFLLFLETFSSTDSHYSNFPDFFFFLSYGSFTISFAHCSFSSPLLNIGVQLDFLLDLVIFFVISLSLGGYPILSYIIYWPLKKYIYIHTRDIYIKYIYIIYIYPQIHVSTILILMFN